MKVRKKKALTLFALTLLVTSLLLINMNGPTSAQGTGQPIYLHGPPLRPIHMHSNITLKPIHMHSLQGILWPGQPPLTEPNCTTDWHELYPNYSTTWHLSSWYDLGDPYDELSPNDQIDMNTTLPDGTNRTEWFHVDRMTITLILSGPYDDYNHTSADPTMAIELKMPWYDPYIITDPLLFNNTLWHEVWPSYSNVYQLTSWQDDLTNPDGNLSITDSIDLVDVNTGIKTYWHVEDVATDLILRWKMMEPIGTWWHELYPEYSRWYNLTSWEESPDDPLLGIPSPSDQIDMTEKVSGNKTWYHVDRVTITINVTNVYTNASMMLELKTYYFEEMYYYLKHPWNSLWHEVYPNYSNVYNLTWWDPMDPWFDNCNGVLDPSDHIVLLNMTGEIPTEELYHIEDMSYDLILNKKITDPVSTTWHELYPQFSNQYHIDAWADNTDGLLSPSDNVTMTLLPTGTTEEYHVENVTLTLNLTGGIYIESTLPFEELYLPKTEPIGTLWHEIHPTFSTEYLITNWTDNCNGVLDYCDDIELTPVGSLVGTWYHVEEVAIDMTVKKIEVPPPPPPPPELYWKQNYTNYAPSGMPDFDQKQDLWNVTAPWGGPWWTWCAPTAVANSLWWMDSRFHPSNLLTNYTAAGEHHPNNTVPFIQHLAYLMDTDGQRTGLFHMGTWTWDIETGIAQYLSWSGVNPLGDVNGDGIVDMTDYTIVLAANGTSPGMPGWDMAADIWPVTLGWPIPGVADNIVDNNDLNLVTANMNSTGQFYEKTIYMPDFYEVEAEVERSEDVILVLGFWYYDPISGDWMRAYYPDTPYYELGLGHAVTVAGINSTTLQIAISDPAIDAFEAGLTPGRSPVPHAHVPPGNTTTHNNASLVSHDIYNVTFILGNPAGTWALQNYTGNPAAGAPPGAIAVVEAAIITSPRPVEEVPGVNITNVVPSLNQAYPTWGPCPKMYINVTVHNNGTVTANYTVTAYYLNGSTWVQIGTQNITNLDPSNQTTLQFNWNLTGVSLLYHTIKANATGPSGVSDEFIDGQVLIKLPGDVNGDRVVDSTDYGIFGVAWPPGPYNQQCDFNCDNVIDSTDYGMLGVNWGQSY